MELEFFSAYFQKNVQIPNFMKIRPVGAELLHADGRTDMTKLIAASSKFENASVNWLKTRKWHRDIKQLQSGYSSARWLQHMPSVRTSQPGQASLDPPKASCAGDKNNSWAQRNGDRMCMCVCVCVGGGGVTQLQAMILKTKTENFKRKRRNAQIINIKNKKIYILKTCSLYIK